MRRVKTPKIKGLVIIWHLQAQMGTNQKWWRRRESNPRPQWSHSSIYVCILSFNLATVTTARQAVTVASLSIISPVAPETHTPDYPAVVASIRLAGVGGETRGFYLSRES